MLNFYESVIFFTSIFQWMVPYVILRELNLLSKKGRTLAQLFGLAPVALVFIPILLFKENTNLFAISVMLIFFTYIVDGVILSYMAFRKLGMIEPRKKTELIASVFAPLIVIVSFINSIWFDGLSLEGQLSIQTSDILWLKLLLIILISALSLLLPVIFVFNYISSLDLLDGVVSKIIAKINKKIKFKFKIEVYFYKWLVLLGVTIGLVFLANYITDIEGADEDFKQVYFGILSVYHIIIASIFIPWAVKDHKNNVLKKEII